LLGNGLTETLAFNNRLQPCRANVNSAGAYFSHCSDSTPSGNVIDFTMGYNAGTADNGDVDLVVRCGQSDLFPHLYL
jgi:hypothetical protein